MIAFCHPCNAPINCWVSNAHKKPRQVRVDALCHGERETKYIPYGEYMKYRETDRRLVFYRRQS